MKSVLFINIIRYFLLFLSLLGTVCHFAQCTLLSIYQEKTGIPGWFAVGHWQYLVWYICLCISALSAFAICVHATCCKRAHILRGDKCLGIANIMVCLITIAINTFFNDQEPWTNGIVEFKNPPKGLIIHCYLLDEEHDASYPLLFQRCLLVNGTFTICSLLCIFWIILVACTWILNPKKESYRARLPNEVGWKVSGKKDIVSKNMPDSFDHNLFQYQPQQMRVIKNYRAPALHHQQDISSAQRYDGNNHHLYNSMNYHPLSRHFSPPPIPGAWVESKDSQTNSYYY